MESPFPIHWCRFDACIWESGVGSSGISATEIFVCDLSRLVILSFALLSILFGVAVLYFSQLTSKIFAFGNNQPKCLRTNSIFFVFLSGCTSMHKGDVMPQMLNSYNT